MRARTLAAVLAVSIALPARAQQAVPVVLNHLGVVLDSATYHDVRNSPFILGKFAAVDTGFLRGFDGGNGIRLMGKYNFVMFAPPAPRSRVLAGDVSVVLATTRAGDLRRVRAQGPFTPSGTLPVRGNGPPLRADQYDDTSNRLVPGDDDSLSDRLHFAIMEYGAAAARERARVDSMPEADLATSRFLAPYVDADRLLSYLTGATLAVPTADIATLSRVLVRDHVAVFPEGEGAIIRLDGFTLHLVPSYVGAGVKQLQFALTRTAIGNPIYRFGPRSQLRFGPGPIAVWDFDSR